MGIFTCCCCDNFRNSDDGCQDCEIHKDGLVCENCVSERS